MSSPQDQITAASSSGLNKVPRPPCEQYQCVHRTRCSKEQIACLPFVHYVETGHVVPPRTLFVESKPVMSDGRYTLCTKTNTNQANYAAVFSD